VTVQRARFGLEKKIEKECVILRKNWVQKYAREKGVFF
jgi:hypothetical protein